ncbi:hypothetical protein NQ315_011631 [Exocentrus adspersus]|uniref:Uncharacterized protein n=1 Tax=Exocentrus adspersus TaxID=1586481 RepID=A0AAV8V8X1_9CUCU|nr:hypothetical protein NQ315_011631 [Exocentrus adspersus]
MKMVLPRCNLKQANDYWCQSTTSKIGAKKYLSDAIKGLKEECIQAQKIRNVSTEDLQENIDPNIIDNEDFVKEILENTDTLDAFIDPNSLNNADITFEEANYYKDTNLRQDNNVLNSDETKLEKNNSTNFRDVSKGINANEIVDPTDQNNIDINAVEKENSGLK